MNKIRILYLGDKTLGEKVKDFLLKQEDIDIFAPTIEYWNRELKDLLHNIPKPDLILSVNYSKIIPKEILQIPRLGAVNIHHSHNLRIRGRNTCTHAILLARKTDIWEHGTCIHYMVPELDAGPIISSEMVPITEEDTAFTLFNKCEDMAYYLVEKHLPTLWRHNTVKTTEPNPDFYTFKAKDLPDKCIDFISKLYVEVYDLVRSLTFPGYEKPYCMEIDEKTYLSIVQQEGWSLVMDDGEGHRVYGKDTK